MAKETWERRIKQFIEKKEQYTAGISNAKGEAVSTFDVIEVKPNRQNDAETYLLSGTEESCLEQASLFFAFSEMLTRRLGGFNFEAWINDFEYEFPYHGKDLRTPAELKLAWGKPHENRPRLTKLALVAGATIPRDYLVYRFLPDRKETDKFFILSGKPEEIAYQALAIMNNQRLLIESELGHWLGYPQEEYMRGKPQQIVSLKIILTTEKTPPFYKKGNKFFSQRQVSIPFVNVSKLNYNAIRALCGGSTGQIWGEWTARAYISSPELPGYITRMEADGSTKATATANLDKFLAFSNCTIHRRTCGEVDLTKGTTAKNPNNKYLSSFKVYPAWCYVMNPKLLAAEDLAAKGKQTMAGKQISKQGKLFLWQEKLPQNWEQHLKELLKSPLLKMVKP